MRVLAVIPARYASTRFPAKPLALLGGKPIVQWVYEAVAKAVERVVVATDDQRIYDAVVAFGGEAVMTSTEHQSGTDRCAEAFEKCGYEADIVVNVQGDEPFIAPEQIATLLQCFENETVEIATLAREFKAEEGIEALENPNSPKVVISPKGEAVYFSRSVVPYLRDVERSKWLEHHTFYKHVGIYAFRAATLGEITRLPLSPMERAERLEQLRWLESGYKIGVGITDVENVGIDTPDDLQRAEILIKSL